MASDGIHLYAVLATNLLAIGEPRDPKALYLNNWVAPSHPAPPWLAAPHATHLRMFSTISPPSHVPRTCVLVLSNANFSNPHGAQYFAAMIRPPPIALSASSVTHRTRYQQCGGLGWRCLLHPQSNHSDSVTRLSPRLEAQVQYASGDFHLLVWSILRFLPDALSQQTAYPQQYTVM